VSTDQAKHLWLPELIYVDGELQTDVALVSDAGGTIVGLANAAEIESRDFATVSFLKQKVLLPGLVNAHSHAFQRVIRGRTEYRSQNSNDSFWTWRELMYAAANKLDPDDIYAASQMAFMEMALLGITSVGEFHYIHKTPDGQSYDDPNLLAKEVVRAAKDVGLRIALLRVAYERAGFQKEPNPLQSRFLEDTDTYLNNLQRLTNDLKANEKDSWSGAAPHSVRAVSLDYLKAVGRFANREHLPIHMHVAEQPAEVSACIEEHGRSPVALLDTEGLLNEKFTAVHSIHITPKAIAAIAKSGATVCACPTTERNLGDGVIPADGYFESNVPICLGSDSQTQIDLFEDARELEYHLRLQRKERNVLAPAVEDRDTLASRLFGCATTNGARSIGFDGARIAPGMPADFFTVDLNDASIAGASRADLLANIVFSVTRSAIKDVVVGGKPIIVEGRHQHQEQIIEKFKDLQKRLWN